MKKFIAQLLKPLNKWTEAPVLLALVGKYRALASGAGRVRAWRYLAVGAFALLGVGWVTIDPAWFSNLSFNDLSKAINNPARPATQPVMAAADSAPTADSGSKSDAPDVRPPAKPGVVGYVFAKASPLQVSDNPQLTGGNEEHFKFGVAYEVVEQTSTFVKIILDNGKAGYVRAAHVSFVRVPKWLSTTNAFNKAERARIRFWESQIKLNDFLAGINTLGSQWDYEEYYTEAPTFQVKLPYLETDALDFLGGKRQVKIFSVMLPVAREAFQTFEQAKAGVDLKLDLYLLADVSGSTNKFLETAIKGIAEKIQSNKILRGKVVNVVVATFGTSEKEKSTFLGPILVSNLARINWHNPRSDQTTFGDSEPLVDGLVALSRGAHPPGGGVPVVIVLSGAEVDQSGYIAALNKNVSIGDVDLKLPNLIKVIFAQVTPEPGKGLRDASQKLRRVPSTTYLEYSESISDGVVAEVIKYSTGAAETEIDRNALEKVGKVANGKHMIAFLPRVLKPNSALPQAQNYAAHADWYTVRVWVTLDDLTWKEESVD